MSGFSRQVQAYILTVIAVGGIALLIGLPQQFETSELVLFITLAVSGVLAGMWPLPLVDRHGRMNLTGAVLLVAVFTTSVPMACLLAAVIATVPGLTRGRKIWSTLFNAGSNVLSVGLATALYEAAADPQALPLDHWGNVMVLYVSASAYWISINAMTSVLVAARNREPFLRTFLNSWRHVYLQCIMLTLLAVLGTAAWRSGPVYAFLLFVPAVAVYQWLSTTREEQLQAVHAIELIAQVLDRRNPFTYEHSKRVSEHAVNLARHLDIGPRGVEAVRQAALIHDIGKLGGEDNSEESSAGRDLTEYQFYILKQHAHLGAMIAREIPALAEAEEAIRYHHDWYDGSHVSRAHAREEIPLWARIIAVADSYDCLRMASGEASLAYYPLAIEQLRAMGGKQLDPELLALFLQIMEEEHAAKPAPSRVASPAKTTAS